MSRKPSPAIHKRNQGIKDCIKNGYSRKEAAEEYGVSVDTVRSVLKESKQDYMSRDEIMEERKPKPFRPHLEEGQTVILKEREISWCTNNDRTPWVENEYTVKEVHKNLVYFERINQHGELIKASYQWNDLRDVLKMEGESVAC